MTVEGVGISSISRIKCFSWNTIASRHYLGTHFLTLMVKGEEKAKASFEVERAD